MSCSVSNTTISFLNVFYSSPTTNSDIFLLEYSTFKRALFLLYVCIDLKMSLELHALGLMCLMQEIYFFEGETFLDFIGNTTEIEVQQIKAETHKNPREIFLSSRCKRTDMKMTFG